MKLCRVQHGEDIWLACHLHHTMQLIVKEEDRVTADVVRDAIAAGVDLTRPAGPVVSSADTTLLAPLRNPSKFLAVGLNYRDHAEESGMAIPSAPVFFSKATTSIVGPGEPISYDPVDSRQVDYEVELAVVIGRHARRIHESAADDYILGYTVCNDVSARDAQFADGQWVRGKSFDTFAPLGPWIVTKEEMDEPSKLAISCTVNGQLLQNGHTSDMIFSPAEAVAYASRFMTLLPGDVIITGTPAGVGFARKPPIFLQDGDTVSCEIQNIGTLTNPVEATGTSANAIGQSQSTADTR